MSDYKLSCEVAQDLLPLYVDGVCSEGSRRLVEAHLAECEDCRRVLADLEESEAETQFQAEAKAVISAHNKRQSRLALAVGLLVSVFLSGLMGVMLYVTAKGWCDWQTTTTVAASLLFLAGFTAVPLLAKGKRFTKAIVATTLALVLVIVCTETFFVQDGMLTILQMCTAVIFSISLVGAPVVLYEADLPAPYGHHKLVIATLWDSLWFVLMMMLLVVSTTDLYGFIMKATLSLVAVVWLIVLSARYLKVHWVTKFGITVALLALWTAVGIHYGWAMIDGLESPLLVGGVGTACGAVLALIGAVLGRKRKIQ